MPLTTTVALALFCGSGIFVVLALIVARNHYPLGARYMSAAMLGVAVWYLGAAGEMLATSPLGALLFRDFRFIGVVTVAPSFFLFVARYLTGRGAGPRTTVALYAFAAVSLLLVWTNPLHELMWPHPHHPPMRPDVPRVEWGPWFEFVHAPFNYLVLGAAMVLLAREVVRPNAVRRRQAAVLLGATLLPFVVYVYNPSIPDVQLTPLAFGVTALVASAGFFRSRIFQLHPMALRTVFDSVGEAVLVVDATGHVAHVNAFTGRLFGVAPEALIGRPMDAVASALALPPGTLEPAAGRHEVVTGRGIVLQLEVSPVGDRAGERGRVIVAHDVTARRAAEDALRRSEEMVRSILDSSPNGVLRLRTHRTDAGRIRDFACVLANPSAARYLALPLDRIVGARLTQIDPPHVGRLFDFFRRIVETDRTDEVELRTTGRHGELWFRVLGTPLGDDVSVTFINITARKRRELHMEAAALEDPLTGLLNRRGFTEDAEAILADAGERAAPRRFALLYIDLNDFKAVNDTHGHDAGDAVLVEFARRLEASTRAQDLVGRIGGDEFVVLATDCDDAVARELCARIDRAARTPFRIHGRAAEISCSIGTALLPPHDGTLDELLRSADRAMYRNKRAGGQGD